MDGVGYGDAMVAYRPYIRLPPEGPLPEHVLPEDLLPIGPPLGV